MVTKDVLEELAQALSSFMMIHNTVLLGNAHNHKIAKECWETLREKCQQASQWLEHAVVEPTDRKVLKSALNNAEKTLQENNQYDPRRGN